MDEKLKQFGDGERGGEPVDALLDPLMEEVLSPEGVEGGLPAGLEGRVYAASVGGLKGGRGSASRGWWRVWGRGVVYAVAACVVAAVLVGVVTGVFRAERGEQADQWAVLSDDLEEAMGPIEAVALVQMAQSTNGFESVQIDLEMESLQSSFERALSDYELETQKQNGRSELGPGGLERGGGPGRTERV